MTPDVQQQQIALITGANRGLGRAAALHLARAGVDVVATYRSNAAEADAVVAEVEALGRRAVALPLDVRDVASFGAFIDTVRGAVAERFNRDTIDILINNGGTGVGASFAETTEEQFDEMLEVHVKGVFFLTQALLPLLADGGSIVNVSTGLTRFVFPGRAVYATAKGALEVLTRHLAAELGPRGIRVNTIAPGAIATDFGGGASRDNEELRKVLASVAALGRVGEPDDVGSAIAGLVVHGGPWVTGQRIEVSGGTRL